MFVDYCKLNQVLVLIEAVVLDMLSLLEEIKKTSGTAGGH